LSDEEDYPHRALINFSDNRIDAATGTLRVRGVISNPPINKRGDVRVFSPGLFTKVRLPVGSPHRELLVPEEAIGTDQGRKYLYLVKDVKKKRDETSKVSQDAKGTDGVDHVVEDRTVEVGPPHNGMRVIVSGLKPGEMVIVSGLQRVRPKSKVAPRLREETATSAAAATASR
jgi:multidrug efflux pump subunit AcrA (membrane-fusion protein)